MAGGTSMYSPGMLLEYSLSHIIHNNLSSETVLFWMRSLYNWQWPQERWNCLTPLILSHQHSIYNLSPARGREGREGKILCGRRKPQKKTTEARIHSERKVRWCNKTTCYKIDLTTAIFTPEPKSTEICEKNPINAARLRERVPDEARVGTVTYAHPLLTDSLICEG